MKNFNIFLIFTLISANALSETTWRLCYNKSGPKVSCPAPLSKYATNAKIETKSQCKKKLLNLALYGGALGGKKKSIKLKKGMNKNAIGSLNFANGADFQYHKVQRLPLAAIKKVNATLPKPKKGKPSDLLDLKTSWKVESAQYLKHYCVSKNSETGAKEVYFLKFKDAYKTIAENKPVYKFGKGKGSVLIAADSGKDSKKK
jgi:hypothetical protein